MITALQVPVSNEHKIERWEQRSRTPEQFQTVRKIVERDDFDFSCGSDIFGSNVGGYTGPFVFLYCTTDGVLHAVRIGKRGRIIRRVTA